MRVGSLEGGFGREDLEASAGSRHFGHPGRDAMPEKPDCGQTLFAMAAGVEPAISSRSVRIFIAAIDEEE
jgi:hypothetical protein